MRVTLPLQSLTAHGTIAGNLTFSVRHGRQLARFQRKQKDRITAPRTAQRNKFAVAMSMWPLHDFGKMQFGYNLVGSHFVNLTRLPLTKRAPQFARFVSDVLTFYV